MATEPTRTNATRARTGSVVCPACRFKVRARKDGTVGSHHLWAGHEYLRQCEGTGQQPLPAVQWRGHRQGR